VGQSAQRGQSRVVSESEEAADRSAHEELSAGTRQPFSRRETQPAAVSGCDPSEKVIARWLRIAKAAGRFDEQPQNQIGCGERLGDEQQQDPLSRLANVAALTRESPSAARVSSVFNAQLGGAG
jgi:hypothetical protein